MTNPYNPVQNALDAHLGPCAATPWAPSATLASASGEGTFSSSPCKLYGFSYSITATNTGLDLRLINTTATAIGTPVLYQIKALPVGYFNITFPRPILFDKGMYFVNSATGTATPQIYMHWGP